MKVSLNNKDYYTDDFTEEQTAKLEQIQRNHAAVDILDYQLSCVKVVGKVLTTELENMLEPEVETKAPATKKKIDK